MIVGTSSKVSEESKISADNSNRVSDDGRLISEARSDPEAFGLLCRRHYDAVFRYCVHRLFERQTAEDVTSAVFLKVVENLHSFKGTERQFSNWLYKIATNTVNSHLRKTARRAGLLKIAGEQADKRVVDCESTAELSDKKLAILREAMLGLRPRYQAIIALRFFENLKLTEIAEVLGSSDGTIRSQLARALAKLRKKMGTFQQEVSEND